MSKKTQYQPKLLSVIKLAQFSGAEVSEKSNTKFKNIPDILSLSQLQQKLEESKEDFNEIAKKSFINAMESGKLLFLQELADKKFVVSDSSKKFLRLIEFANLI